MQVLFAAHKGRFLTHTKVPYSFERSVSNPLTHGRGMLRRTVRYDIRGRTTRFCYSMVVLIGKIVLSTVIKELPEELIGCGFW